MIKKVKLLIGVGIMAYEVYGVVKRSRERKALEEAALEIESLEKKITTSKANKFPVKRKNDSNERRRDFRR